MPRRPRRGLRLRILVELGVLSVLSAAVVLVFPQRPVWSNGVLALCGLALITFNRQFTRVEIWALFPVDHTHRESICGSLRATALFTLLGVLALFLLAGFYDREQNVSAIDWLRVLPVYLVWGLLQQYLFQFFLLGRLLVLMPAPLAIVATGMVFGLVHLPQPVTAGVTLLAGCVWSAVYYRYRVLWPLGVSHALLGAVLFHAVYGQNLLEHWSSGR